MNKTRIEWTDFTWNPITGCSNDCFYCYARKMAERFHKPFTPTFHQDRLIEPTERKKPLKIFVSSMGEFFDPKVPFEWREMIYDVMKLCPQHTFQILTKQPQNMLIADWKALPTNVWLGTTITTKEEGFRANFLLRHKGVKFISFEPMLGPADFCFERIDWIIIGAMTGPGGAQYQPKTTWVLELVNKAKRLGIPVFFKNNLKPILECKRLPQEFPK